MADRWTGADTERGPFDHGDGGVLAHEVKNLPDPWRGAALSWTPTRRGAP
jgi:hypothetical protein